MKKIKFNLAYESYANQFKAIATLLNEFPDDDKTYDDLMVYNSAFSNLRTEWNNVVYALKNVAKAKARLNYLIQESDGNPSLLNKKETSERLGEIAKALDAATQIPNLMKVVQDKLNQLPKSAKQSKDGKKILKHMDVEETEGMRLIVFSRKAQQANTMLSTLGLLEIINTETDLYNGVNNEKSIVALRKKYDKALNDYERIYNTTYPDESEGLTRHVIDGIDQRVQKREDDLKSAEQTKADYDSQDYSERQAKEHERLEQELKQNDMELNSAQEEVSKDTASVKKLEELLPSLKNLREKLQKTMEENSAEKIAKKISNLKKERKKIRNDMKNNPAWAEWQKRNSARVDYGNRNKSIAAQMEKMSNELLAADDALESLNDFRASHGKRFLRNVITFSSMKSAKLDPFKFAWGASFAPEEKAQIMERIRELVPDATQGDTPTVKDIQKYIKATKRKDFEETREDVLLGGVVAYVKMMPLEGMMNTPAHVDKKIVNAQNKKGDTVLSKQGQIYQIEVMINSIINGYRAVVDLGNESQINDTIQKLEEQIRSATNEEERKLLYGARLDNVLRKSSMAENANKANNEFIERIRALQKMCDEYNFDPSLLDGFCQNLGFKKFQKKNNISFSQYIETQVSKLTPQWYSKIGESVLPEEIQKQGEIYTKEDERIKALRDLLPRYQTTLFSNLVSELREMNGMNDEESCYQKSKEAVQHSKSLLLAEVKYQGPKFEEYYNLCKEVKEAEKVFDGTLYSKEEKSISAEIEKLNKELLTKKVEQRELVAVNSSELSDLILKLDESTRKRMNSYAKKDSKSFLTRVEKMLKGNDYIPDNFFKECIEELNKMIYDAKADLQSHTNNLESMLKKQIALQNDFHSTSPESVESRRLNAQQKVEEEKKKLEEAKNVKKYKDEAVNLRLQVHNAEKKLSEVYKEHRPETKAQSNEDMQETISGEYSAQFQSQIAALLDAKNHLPKRKMGSDSDVYKNMFKALQNIQGKTDMADIRDGLHTVKAAANAYIEARKDDTKWLWYTGGKSASGRARLELAADIIRFCDAQNELLKNSRKSEQVEIKKTVERVDYEEYRGEKYNIKAKNLAEEDINQRINDRREAEREKRVKERLEAQKLAETSRLDNQELFKQAQSNNLNMEQPMFNPAENMEQNMEQNMNLQHNIRDMEEQKKAMEQQ